MKSHKLVSVIIPIYNIESYLERCIESIILQTYQNIEIILVDDGSSDNCGMICDNYAKEDSRIKVIHKKNGGASSARNAGLQAASGEYIGFVDSDDYIEPEMYETLVTALEKEQVDIVCVGIIRENHATGKKAVIFCPAKETKYDAKTALHEILRSANIGLSVWSKLYKNSIFDNIRFPEGEMNEEANILIPMHINRTVYHTAKPLYHYTEREHSVTSKYNKKRSMCAWNNSLQLLKQTPLHYPELKKDAEYYFANQLFKILISYQSQNFVKDPMTEKYFNAYKKYWYILLFSSTFSFINKLKCILIRINAYKSIRKWFRHP